MTQVDTVRNEMWQFVSQIPPVTRGLCLLLVLICLIQRLQILPAQFSDFGWSLTWATRKFQIWRLLTSFLILPMDAMTACFQLHTIYSKSQHLELIHFQNNSVDYLFYICFNFAQIILIVELFQIKYPIFTNAFTGMLIYTWTMDNSNVKVMFYSLFPILGKYLSLVHLFVSFLFDDGVQGYNRFCITMIGFTSGYVYSCLDTRSYGPLYGYLMKKEDGYGTVNRGQFRAPRWFSSAVRWFDSSKDHGATSARARSRTRARMNRIARTNFAGSGNRLGSKTE